jgi:hypothetical protein
MLFLSTEKSRQEEVSHLFKSIHDGTQKNYPNATVMLFIPLQEIKLSSLEFCKKISLITKSTLEIRPSLVLVGFKT